MTVASTVPAVRERQRVHTHLLKAERWLAAHRPKLAPLQALVRASLLAELRRYRSGGRYPLNPVSRAQPVPLFIDQQGTPCAVAHLMQISGQGELVRHIARTDNTARVQRLARLPEVRAWLAAAGLSWEEAARIQPSYCFLTEAEACFCEQSGLAGLGLGTVVRVAGRTVQVSVERVEGELSGVATGEQVAVEAVALVGERILFRHIGDAGVSSRVGHDLLIEGDVRCQLNERTQKRPISIDTAFESLLAERSSCVDVLRTDDSGWNQSQCTETNEEDGCGLAAPADASIGSTGLASAALLLALFTYRRRRRG